MSETTFCDILDFCDVWGHKEAVYFEENSDFCNNIIHTIYCQNCPKIKKILIERSKLRTSNYNYPDGEWK